MEAAGKKDRQRDYRGKHNDQPSLPKACRPPAQESCQNDDQTEFEQGKDVAVKAGVPIADRAAEHPFRDWPELTTGVVVMGQKVGGGVQETGTREGTQDVAPTPA